MKYEKARKTVLCNLYDPLVSEDDQCQASIMTMMTILKQFCKLNAGTGLPMGPSAPPMQMKRKRFGRHSVASRDDDDRHDFLFCNLCIK